MVGENQNSAGQGNQNKESPFAREIAQTQENKGQQHQGLFQQKPQGPSPEILELNSQISEVSRRIRILEDRYSNLRRKAQVTDQNMLTIEKNIKREIKTVDSQLNTMQKSINELDEKMKQILREVNNFASSEEIKILKRYLEFWQPVNFVTKKEAEMMVENKIGQ